jgi:hypothetical protein
MSYLYSTKGQNILSIKWRELRQRYEIRNDKDLRYGIRNDKDLKLKVKKLRYFLTNS